MTAIQMRCIELGIADELLRQYPEKMVGRSARSEEEDERLEALQDEKMIAMC